MSRRTENLKKLERAFDDSGITGRMMRVENILDGGMPRAYYRVHGYSGWIEVKTGDGGLSSIQKEWHDAERAAGGHVSVIYVSDTDISVDNGDGRVDFQENWRGIIRYIIYGEMPNES